ncbi:MAG: hypothetical protein JXP34_17580 [Planctomycetes bacterium]|nr:hypothetical protein [Planctomycetota bacterium]
MKWIAILALAQAVSAAEPFVLRVEDEAVFGVGTRAAVSVLLDAPDRTRRVCGFTVALAHDPEFLRLGGIEPGSASRGSAGPDGIAFFVPVVGASGGTARIRISIGCTHTIPPGYRAEILRFIYTTRKAGETGIRFTSDIDVTSLADAKDAVIPHVEVNGTIRIADRTAPAGLNDLFVAAADGCVAPLRLDGTSAGLSVCTNIPPEWVVVDGRGTVWLSGLDASDAPAFLGIRDSVAHSIPIPAAADASGPTAGAICAARGGGIWAIAGAEDIYRVHPDGTFRRAFTMPGAHLRDLAVDRSGNLWTSDGGDAAAETPGRVIRLLPWRVEVPLPDARWLAADGAGHVWASGGATGIVKLRGDGAIILRIPLAQDAGDIAVDGTGALIVTVPGNGSVLRFATDGTLLAWNVPPAGATHPLGIAVDGENAIWIADEERGEVVRYAGCAQGEMREILRRPVGRGPVCRGDFSGLAAALAADPEGNFDGDAFANAIEIERICEGMNPLDGDPPPPTPPPSAVDVEGVPKQGLRLSWQNEAQYDAILIRTAGATVELPGVSTEFRDGDFWSPLLEGTYDYEITALLGGESSLPQEARDTVGSGEVLGSYGWGPQPRWPAIDETGGYVFATDPRDEGYQIIRFSAGLEPLGEVLPEPVFDAVATGLLWDPRGAGGEGSLWVLEGDRRRAREVRIDGVFTGRAVEIEAGYEPYASILRASIDPTGDEWFCLSPEDGWIVKVSALTGEILGVLDHPQPPGEPLDTGLACGPEGVFAIEGVEGTAREAIEIRFPDGSETGRRVPLGASEDPVIAGLAFRTAQPPWQWDLVASESFSGDLLVLRGSLPRFVRGDCNWDGGFNLADPVFLLYYLFGGDGDLRYVPECVKACKMDLANPILAIGEPIAMLNALFADGPPPPPPYPACGSETLPETRTVQICDPEAESPACP